jgi:molecular chaperone DnaJ
MVTCPKCKGTGTIKHGALLGFGQVIVSCDRCNGRGEIAEKTCKVCKGNGLEERRVHLQIQVPPGVDNGDHLVLRGQGEDGPYGGPLGDFYVMIRIKPHPYLTRRGMDLIYETNINLAQATLGTDIKVPTLTSEKTVHVPPGTQYGTMLRLKGEGMNSSQGRGDELVHINVRVPEKLTPKQRELIEELAKEFEAEELNRRKWRG